MASSSPSEFLTFYRRLTTHPSLRSAAVRTPASRPFTIATARYASKNIDPKVHQDSHHATDKNDKYDVQDREVHKGKEAHATGTGGTATSRKDERSSTARAKKDHPEAPDVVIGMQDERGAKGH